MAIEIEKKYRLSDAERSEILAALNEFGATATDEGFEENIIFSNTELSAKNAAVRIRRMGQGATLTYKQRIPDAVSNAKHQLEFETEIADADIAVNILEGAGLSRRLVYEKRRRTFRFRDVEVVLDQLPFGLFMEIEGTITGIAEAEMLLGADQLEVENETYPRLTARLGSRHGEIIEARFPTP